MLAMLYVGLLFFSLILFIASYVWHTNPFLPFFTFLVFIVLAGESPNLTQTFSEYNSTSMEIITTNAPVHSYNPTWLTYLMFAFAVLMIIEGITRMFGFTIKSVQGAAGKDLNRRLR